MNALVLNNSTEVVARVVLVVQCAWCGRLKRSGVYSGRSHPLVHELGGHDVSHGICPACLAKVEAAEGAGRCPRAAVRLVA